MRTLDRSFYLNDDVVSVARNLLGKVLVTRFNGQLTAGIITETEAYNGTIDKASHAFGGRRTARTSVMYEQGGTAYVYLCYGIHYLFNVVTNIEGIPHAVLIRNMVPIEGADVMMKRRKRTSKKQLLTGPGTLTQALGIDLSHNGVDLCNGPVRIEDHCVALRPEHIRSGPRIGVAYAAEDASLPYRFILSYSAITGIIPPPVPR